MRTGDIGVAFYDSFWPMGPSDFYELGDFCLSGVYGYVSFSFGLFALDIYLT